MRLPSGLRATTSPSILLATVVPQDFCTEKVATLACRYFTHFSKRSFAPYWRVRAAFVLFLY